MTLTPSQQEWAQQHLGDERNTTHTGTITKVTSKKGGWVATVEDPDGRIATFDLMGVDKETADVHVGQDSAVAVTGKVVKIIEQDARVGLEIKTTSGTTVEWVQPPPMSEAEQDAVQPTPPPQEPVDEQSIDDLMEQRLLRVMERPAVRSAIAAVRANA